MMTGVFDSFTLETLVTKAADIGGKRLISLSPDAWVQWVMQSSDVIAREIVNSEFQWVSHQNDVLIKAFSPSIGEFLILSELQLRYNERLPRRIRAYAALAEEKYNLPTYPVLINILPPPSTVTICDRFEHEFLGLQARQDYRVINLWQVNASIVFEQSISTLLPFVPVLQGGDDPELVQQAVQLLRSDETLSEMEPLLGFFASFVLETELVSRILRWDMAVLRESPWYQEILQEGFQRERDLILRQLARRIGNIPAEVRSQLQALTLTELEALGEDLLDFSEPADLTNWLQAH